MGLSGPGVSTRGRYLRGPGLGTALPHRLATSSPDSRGQHAISGISTKSETAECNWPFRVRWPRTTYAEPCLCAFGPNVWDTKKRQFDALQGAQEYRCIVREASIRYGGLLKVLCNLPPENIPLVTRPHTHKTYTPHLDIPPP